jgi:FimV-like protein
VGELENSLTVLIEDLNRSLRANSELNVRLDDATSQLETISKLVKLKDDQLAGLRAELQRQEADIITQPTFPAVVQQFGGLLLRSPLSLVGVGVLLIGLVAGTLMIFRKRRQNSQLDDNEFNEVMIGEGKPQLSWSDEAGEGFEEDSKNTNEDLGVDDGDLDDLDAETDDYDLELTVDIGEELILDEAMELGDLDLAVDDLGLDLVDDDALDLDLDGDGLELSGDDDQFNLDQDASSKLDLARAYIEMGDSDGAKPLLEEVLSEGDDEQVREANELIGNIR